MDSWLMTTKCTSCWEDFWTVFTLIRSSISFLYFSFWYSFFTFVPILCRKVTVQKQDTMICHFLIARNFTRILQWSLYHEGWWLWLLKIWPKVVLVTLKIWFILLIVSRFLILMLIWIHLIFIIELSSYCFTFKKYKIFFIINYLLKYYIIIYFFSLN